MSTIAERLELLISATTTKARDEFDKLGASVKSTFGDFGKFKDAFAQGIGIGAGESFFDSAINGLQGIANAAINASKAAEGDARSQFTLAQAIRNNTAAGSEGLAGAEDYISALQNQAAIADDELRPALATLVRSTHDVTEAQKLLGLSADVAAGTGTDLGSVADALAKAYNGNTKALKALAPEITGLIRDGASAAEIFTQLQSVYSGTAQGLADVSPWQRLNIQIDEAQEKLGYALLPYIGDLADALTAAGPYIDNSAEVVYAASDAFRQFAGAVAQAIDELKYFNPIYLASKGLNLLGVDAGFASGHLLDAAAAEAEAAEKATAAGSAMGSLSFGLNNASQAADKLRDSAKGAAGELFGADNAQAKFLKTVRDTGGAAGSTAKQIESAYRRIADAQQQVTDSQRALEEAQFNRFLVALGPTTDDITLAQIAERDSTRSLTEAQRALADAQDRLNKLRQGADQSTLLDAEANNIEAQRRLVDAQNGGDVAKIKAAQADLLRSEKALADARNPGTVEDIAKAEDAVAAAQDGVTRAEIEAKRSRQALNDLINAGKEGSKELAAANKQVDDAQRNLDKSSQSLADALDALNTSSSGLGGTQKSVNDRFLEGIGAADGWLQKLIDGRSTPEEFASAIGTIYANLKDVADQAGQTGALDTYLGKLTDIYTTLHNIQGAQVDISPRSSANAAEETLNRARATVQLNLDGKTFGEAVVSGLLVYQNSNGSVPIKVR